jgi:hypothetical protein
MLVRLSGSRSRKFRLRFSENYDFHKTSRASQRGVTANRHETWARDAMDALGVERASSARTNDARRTAEACGPGTPGLVLSLRDVS